MRYRFTIWLTGLLLLLAGARADEFDVLRQRWLDLQFGPTNLDLTDSDVAAHLATQVSSAQFYWTRMLTGPARPALWSDAAQWATTSADITASYDRLRILAQAWATRGSALQGNTNLLAAIIGGLDWLQAHAYNATTAEYDNWWEWEIGTPQSLNDTVALVYAQLSVTQLTNYMAAVNKFTPTANMTAANQVDKALVVAVRGILVKDGAKIAAARDALSNVFPYVSSGDGFYTDGSFIQHDCHPYTGSYGSVVLGHLAPLMHLLCTSTWQVTDPNQTNVVRWVYDAFAPMLYKGALLDGVRGRAISRWSSPGHAAGADAIASIIRLAQYAPAADAATLKGLVKAWIQTDTTHNFVGDTTLPIVPLAKSIQNDAGIVPAGERTGHTHFGHMDRAVHLRPGWGCALSLSSARIANYECINTENLHGWYTGDGMLYLLNNDLTQFDGGFWPTVNPYRLPGTTVDTQPRADASGESYCGATTWVGGAALDGMGSAGMQLAAWNSTLTARKAWFMFNDEIICLGAGLTSTDGRTIETIIENRKLAAGGTNSFFINGAAQPTAPGWTGTLSNATWAALAGNVPGADLGYYFPQPATVRALRETRTNAWSSINAFGPTDPVCNSFLTLWFDHGTNPAAATYAYVLLPNRAAPQVAAYAANPTSHILTNAAWAQGVTNSSLGLTAVNFWNNGTNSLGGITVDKQAAVIARQSNYVFSVAVADPTQVNSNDINITFNRAATGLIAADAGVTVVQLAPLLKLAINVAGAGGKSFHATFSTEPLPCYPLTVQSVPASEGSTTGGGAYPAGSCVTITATPNAGWQFLGWNDGLRDNPRDVVVPTGGVTCTAILGAPASLAQALEATNVTWTLGGNAAWYSQTGTKHGTASAAQSGALSAGQTSYFQMTTNGPGSLQFWWKASAAAANTLQFYIDTQLVSQISGNADWNQYVGFIGTSNTVTLKWVYTKHSAAVSGSDAGWVDQVTWLPCPYAEHVPQVFYQDPTGLLASWVLNGTGGMRFARLLANTGGWTLKAAGDIDGDGVSDLLFQTASGETGGWFMNADGSTRSARSWLNLGGWEIKACGNYEGSNNTQLFFQTARGDVAYWRLDTNGNSLASVSLGNMGRWKLRGLGDLDGDHKAELFWQDPAGTVAIWYHKPDGSIRGLVPCSIGGWILCGVADIDADGVSDLLWQDGAGNTGGWFMNSNGTFRTAHYWWNTGGWKLKAAGR